MSTGRSRTLRLPDPLITAAIARRVFAASVPVAARLGAEFMPRLDEGDLLIEASRLPSASLEGRHRRVDGRSRPS